MLPAATVFGVVSFSVGGPGLWLSTFLAGFLGGITFPALAVYRTELFPTGNRGRAAGLITAAALLGGIGGLIVMGQLLDRRLAPRAGDGAARHAPRSWSS